jgi:hypothetical protein
VTLLRRLADLLNFRHFLGEAGPGSRHPTVREARDKYQ